MPLFTAYKFLSTTGSTTRSMPDRIADVFNVKDYGALGNNSNDDASAIQACINAAGNGTVYFPPGSYKVNSSIDIGTAGTGGGRILGSGALITGNLPNGFVFYKQDGSPGNGPDEIGYLGLSNTSTNVGSGCLMMSNTSCHIHHCGFTGMINILLPFNIYDMIIERCGGAANQNVAQGTGYNGTLGVAGYAPHIIGWRSTATRQTMFQLYGSNSCALIGNGIENCEVAIMLGMYTGWASHCTVASDVLTVGGMIGTGEGYFINGVQLYGSGLTLKPWNSDPDDPNHDGTWIIGDHSTDGTLTGTGNAGTYRLNKSYTITTPVPMWTRAGRGISGVTIASLQSEGCWASIVCNSVGIGQISGAGGNSAVGEVPGINGGPDHLGYNPHSGIWIRNSCSNLVISGYGGSSNTTDGSIYFDPGASANGVTFISCTGVVGTDNACTASISNGAGGAGTILYVTAASGSGLAVGMKVDPTGAASVATGTRITAGSNDEPPTTPVTVTIASPAVFTRTSHGLVANNQITLYTTGPGAALPTGLAIATTYFVIAAGLTANTFELSATLAGSAINTSGTQSGTHYIIKPDGSTGLSGYNGIGIYRVNNSQSVSSRSMTIPYGPDWQLPTTAEAGTMSGTGLQFINCTSGNASTTGIRYATTFTSLPGQAGANAFIPLLEGCEYSITDGQKSGTGTALFGDIVVGGGAQHIKVRYNGTNWTRCG